MNWVIKIFQKYYFFTLSVFHAISSPVIFIALNLSNLVVIIDYSKLYLPISISRVNNVVWLKSRTFNSCIAASSDEKGVIKERVRNGSARRWNIVFTRTIRSLTDWSFSYLIVWTAVAICFCADVWFLSKKLSVVARFDISSVVLVVVRQSVIRKDLWNKSQFLRILKYLTGVFIVSAISKFCLQMQVGGFPLGAVPEEKVSIHSS